jgi:DNA-binding response OmpR family regulator
VLLLDDDPDLLDVLAWSLRELCGRESVPLGSYAELVRQADEALSCELALLDVNLGPGVPSGVDALRWLRERGFGGRVAFLTGHARSHPLVMEAERMGGAAISTKPLSPEELAALVDGTHRSTEGVTP